MLQNNTRNEMGSVCGSIDKTTQKLITSEAQGWVHGGIHYTIFLTFVI